MVKTGKHMKLCYASSPSDCARCFPEKSPADFFLREKYIKSLFSIVDVFISPSHFLIDRYIRWGIDKNKIHMIENGQPIATPSHPCLTKKQDNYGKFAFFGQINPYKGVDIMLKAFSLLPKSIQHHVHLDIHGANLDQQSSSYQESIANLISKLKGLVTIHGPYESHEMGKLLSECDWVIIPSVWWENSPMVIQEAFNHSRPLIGTDIGGVAEKITDRVNGLHFRNRNPMSLAHVIEIATKNEDNLWENLSRAIPSTFTISDSADAHFDIY
jgi:glycosyltransferase involved in cell wall biosynthesis